MLKLMAKLTIFIFLVGCSSMGGRSSYELKKYKEQTWENGLKVILVRDDSLPYVSLKMLVDAGSRRDPIAKSGLASFVAGLLKKGTTKRNADKIADDLSEFAVSFSASVSADFAMVQADSLSMNQEQLIQNFSELLTRPAFQNKEIKRNKKIILQSLRDTVDDPRTLVGVAFKEKLYGDHPYGKRSIGKARDVQSFKRKDLLKFYRKYYTPNNSTLAIVGNYNDNFLTQLKSKLNSWKKRDIDNYKYPVVSNLKGQQIQLISKSDLKQTQIVMGHIGIERNSEDFLNLRVANTILGGAFFSRLSNEIRKKRGLTYSIYSYYSPQKDKGPFVVSTFTKHETVGEIVKETVKLIEEFKKNGVTDQELEDSKGLLKGKFPRALETPEKFAENLLYLRFYGIKDGYLKDYLKEIDSISKSDVKEALQKHLRPEDFKVIVYGPKDQVLQQLRPIGVTRVQSYKEFL